MRRFFYRSLLPASLILFLGVVVGMNVDGSSDADDTIEQLRKLEDAYLLINRQYVEDVDASDMTEVSIESMLERLDPHSSYIDAERMKSLQEGYQGSFGGIGIWFEAPPDDTARVSSIISDGPSESAGLMPGDRIYEVNDSSIVGMNSLEIQDRIKGPIGTDVTLSVKRPGVDASITFEITRASIPLYSIDATYMMDDETGYLRIGRFAMTTHDEFVEKVGELKARGMQRLVLDLRGNPGGIKSTAVMIADEMLDGEGVIVSTKGRSERENDVDRITRGGLLAHESVIVLTDEQTASGSEIIAGALQDHDRALIVGRRTFGKGLVQRPFQLRDGSVLQMTVARYYMPSGRLIQTPYEDGERQSYYEQKFEDFEDAVYDPATYLDDIPDSLRYETLHGRTVFGGGGVMPDVVVAPDTLSEMATPIVSNSLRAGLPFLFIRDQFNTDGRDLRSEWDGRRDEFLATFEVSDDLWNRYVEYMKENDFSIGLEADHDEKVFTVSELNDGRETLEVILKARMAQRLYKSEAWYPVYNQIDPVVQTALDLWDSASSLAGVAGNSVSGG